MFNCGGRTTCASIFSELSDFLPTISCLWDERGATTLPDRILLYPYNPTGRNYLKQIGTLRDIAKTGLQLREGMVVDFYDQDGDGEGNRGDLLFEGTVHYDSEEKRWYAIIDPRSWRHQSDERAPSRK